MKWARAGAGAAGVSWASQSAGQPPQWADPGQVKEERNGRRVSRHGDWAIHGVLVTALALARRRDHPG
jgi:hypothetical protein